eukprot:gene12106-5598_t
MSYNAFAQFKTKGISNQTVDNLQDEKLRQYFKHLKKKDPNTKKKALNQIQEIIKSKEKTEVILLLPEWISIMKNLCVDYDKKVRLGSFKVFSEILKIVKKELAPHLKSVIGVWLLGMFDIDSEVMKEANDCFKFSFAKKTPKDILQFCEVDILKYLKNNFSKTPVTLNESMIVSEEEADDNYDRVISSTILVLKYTIETLQSVTAPEYGEIMDSKFFKYITEQKYTTIRSSMYKILNVLFEDYANKIIDLKVVSPLILGCFAEKNPIVHESMIETLIFFLKKYPKECWKNVNASKTVWPKLYNFLLNPMTSSPSVTFPILLPFISLLDYSVFGSDEKTISFFDKFFDSMWKGFSKVQGSSDSLDIIKSYNECIMYVILASSKFAENKEQEFLTHFLTSTFLKSIKSYLEIDFEYSKEFCEQIAFSLKKIFTKEKLIEPMIQFWSKFDELIQKNMGTQKSSLTVEKFSSLIQRLRKEISNKDFNSFIIKLSKTSLEKAMNEGSFNHLWLSLNIYKTFGFENFDDSFDYLNFFEKTLTVYQEYEDQSIQYYQNLFEFVSLYFSYKPEFHEKTFDSMINYFKDDIKIIQKFVSSMITVGLKSPSFEETFMKFVERALEEETPLEEFSETFTLWDTLGHDFVFSEKVLIHLQNIIHLFVQKFIKERKLSSKKIERILYVMPYLRDNVTLELLLDVVALKIDQLSNENYLSSEFIEHFTLILENVNSSEKQVEGYKFDTRNIWLDLVLQGIHETNVNEFNKKSQSILIDSFNSLQTDAKSVFDLGFALEAIDANIWKNVLLNQQAWQKFEKIQNNIWNLTINGNVHIIPHGMRNDETNQLLNSYGRFVDFCFTVLDYLEFEKVLKDSSNSWLIVELLQVVSLKSIFSTSFQKKISAIAEKLFNIIFESEKVVDFIKNLIQKHSQDLVSFFMTQFHQHEKLTKYSSDIVETLLNVELEDGLKSYDQIINSQTVIFSLLSNDDLKLRENVQNSICSLIALSSSVNQDYLSLIINQKFKEEDSPRFINNLYFFTTLLVVYEKFDFDDIISVEDLINNLIEMNEKISNMTNISQKVFSNFTNLLSSFCGNNFKLQDWNKLDYLVGFMRNSLTTDFAYLTSKNEKTLDNSKYALISIHQITKIIGCISNEKYEEELNHLLYDAMIEINKFALDLISMETIYHVGKPLYYPTKDLLTLIANSIIPSTKVTSEKYFTKFFNLIKRSKNLHVQIACYQLLNRIDTKILDDKKNNKKIFSIIEDSPLSITDLRVKTLFDINHSLKDVNQLFGYLLSWWNILEYYISKKDIFETIKENQYFVTLLNVLTSFILKQEEKGAEIDMVFIQNITKLNLKYLQEDYDSISTFCGQFMFQIVKAFPSLVRLWYNQIPDKRIAENIEKFIVKFISPHIIAFELEKIVLKSTSFSEEVSIKVSSTLRQIAAIYEQDEVKLDITIVLPTSYPLKPLVINSSKKLGVNEGMYRKWILKMTTVLFSSESSVWDALELWKTNLDKHFDGVEPCPICYSIVHANDQSLPKIGCKQCKNKYHPQCLYKWFSTSGNQTCPMCRAVNSFN